MAIGRTNAGGGNTFLPNLLDNSDFQYFVAQAGLGGNHGTQAYAGDRWILDSGTVTGTENTNADGYSAITLNGTIRQIVAEPPTGQYACAVEMVSGTATIAYADGEVTITSSGGVLKNAGLYAGPRAPKYMSKGYAATLAECQKYFYKVSTVAMLNGYISKDSKRVLFNIYLPRMRILPSLASPLPQVTIRTVTGYSSIAGNTSPFGTPILQGLEDYDRDGGSTPVWFEFSEKIGTNNTPAVTRLRESGLAFSADL